MTPPGRRVYQKGSYTMWEVDGAQAPVSSLPVRTNVSGSSH